MSGPTALSLSVTLRVFYQGPVDRLWVALVKVGTMEAMSVLCKSKKAAMADASQSMVQQLVGMLSYPNITRPGLISWLLD